MSGWRTPEPEARDADRIRVAVVGLGYWGPNLVRNLHAIDDADLVAVCDARTDRLDAAARRYPGLAATTSFDELLASDDVDAIAIATPAASHHALATAALRAGKHVFVEKPLAASSTEATEMIELADAAGLVLMPGHTFVYSPPVEKIRELIQAGVLGDVYFISTSRVNLGLHQPDVSVAWDLGPHDLSILRYWLADSPTHVTALSRGFILPGTPDVAFINLEYASGAIAHVELAWLAPSKLRRTTVVGSRKMVVYDDTSNEPVRIFDSGVMLENPQTFGEYELTYRTGDIVSPHIQAAEPLAVELTDFCRAIQGTSTPRSCAALGLEVVLTIEAVDASLAANGQRVEVGPLGSARALALSSTT
jgi:predicted dehydrogenase